MEEVTANLALPFMGLLVGVLVTGSTLVLRKHRSVGTCSALVLSALTLTCIITVLVEPLFTEAARKCAFGGTTEQIQQCRAVRQAAGKDPRVMDLVTWVAVPTVIGVTATMVTLTIRDQRRSRN